MDEAQVDLQRERNFGDSGFELAEIAQREVRKFGVVGFHQRGAPLSTAQW